MVTITEIAKLAGVSRGTVDRVIHGRGNVNPEVANRIKQLIKEHGYIPNKASRALLANKKKIKLGILLFGAENPFFDDVIKGVSIKKNEYLDSGIQIITNRIKDINAQEMADAIDSQMEEGISGLVISPVENSHLISKINELINKGIPVVTTNTDLPCIPRLAYVGSDYYLCGKTAGGLMNLITGGKCTVGIITGSKEVLCHSRRVSGFLDVCGKRYPDIAVADVSENFDDDGISFRVTESLLRKHPEINALFLAASGVNGACDAVKSLGRDKTIKIISFDDVPNTRKLVKDGVIAATICQEPVKQGSLPVEILYEYLVNGIKPAKELNYTNIIIKIRELIDNE